MILRIIISLVYIFSISFMPWWLFFAIGIGLVLFLNNYYEFIVAGFLIDILYGKNVEFLDTFYVFTLTSVSIFLIISFIKKNLRY